MRAEKLGKTILVGIAIAGIALPLASKADWNDDAGWSQGDRYSRMDNGSRGKPKARAPFDYAMVTAVQPRYENIETPRQECSREIVGYRGGDDGYRSDSSYAGPVLGAIAGGILGAQVGKGDGRTAASAVGAATGAIVGDRMGRNNYPPQNDQPIYETRCHNWSDSRRVISGYDVSYVYGGATYQSFMDRDPGKWMKVRISVQPAE